MQTKAQRPRTVMVTGAGGFIGSHLCERLLAEGVRVIGIENFCAQYHPAIKEQNLSAALAHPDFVLLRCDICDGSAVKAAFAEHRPDTVCHLAGRAGVRPSIRQPALYSRVNVQGTVEILEAASQHNTQRMIFASSSSVYGNTTPLPFREDVAQYHPISPYAATKRAAELLCHSFWHVHQIPVTCLRFFTVYGPRQRPDLAIHKFMRMIRDGETIPVFGDGSTSRDYTYIDDVIEGIWKAIQHTSTGYEIYNIGGSHPVALRKLIAAIETTIGQSAHLDHQPEQMGDVTHTYADISRAQQALGYTPNTPLVDGLAKQWAWMQAQRTQGKRIT